MRFTCPIGADGCYVVAVSDDAGRLCGLFAAQSPDDFRWSGARLVAAIHKAALTTPQ